MFGTFTNKTVSICRNVKQAVLKRFPFLGTIAKKVRSYATKLAASTKSAARKTVDRTVSFTRSTARSVCIHCKLFYREPKQSMRRVWDITVNRYQAVKAYAKAVLLTRSVTGTKADLIRLAVCGIVTGTIGCVHLFGSIVGVLALAVAGLPLLALVVGLAALTGYCVLTAAAVKFFGPLNVQGYKLTVLAASVALLMLSFDAVMFASGMVWLVPAAAFFLYPVMAMTCIYAFTAFVDNVSANRIVSRIMAAASRLQRKDNDVIDAKATVKSSLVEPVSIPPAMVENTEESVTTVDPMVLRQQMREQKKQARRAKRMTRKKRMEFQQSLLGGLQV